MDLCLQYLLQCSFLRHRSGFSVLLRYDAIAAGDYPEWTLCIQTMDPKDEDK